MIFSKEKWQGSDEIAPYVSVTQLSFVSIEGSLRSAFNAFIRPLLGEDMTAELIAIYASTERSEPETELLKLCQAANAYLAMWQGFDELNTSISDAGMQRSESETQKGLYKYQANSIRENFKTKGFNALDTMLEYIESNILLFSEFETSEYYINQQDQLVESAKVINSWKYINNSRIIYLRLMPELKIAEDLELAPNIGEELLAELRTQLKNPDADPKWAQLKKKIQPVLIFSAISQLIKSTGSLTDRGLYFDSINAGSLNDETSAPANPEMIRMQADQAEDTADEYLSLLLRFIESNFGTYYKGNPASVYSRDNDNKQSNWF